MGRSARRRKICAVPREAAAAAAAADGRADSCIGWFKSQVINLAED